MTETYKEALAEQEEAEYRAKAVNSKFKQQIAYGAGAATVFGLVSGLVAYLLHAATAGAAVSTVAASGATVTAATGIAAALPVIGLVGLAVLGVGLLYLSAKYLSENTISDQALQAKQISAATRGHAPEATVEPVVTPKLQEFPEVMNTKTESMQTLPSTVISNERALADTVTARDTLAAWAA